MDEIIKEEAGGKTSSKKVAGLALIASCIILAFIDQLFDKPLNIMAFTTLFAGGVAFLGASLVKEFKKIKQGD